VTSRERINGLDPFNLDFLSENDAIDLFLKHYSRNELSRDQIQELVRTIDRHTLTLEIMAKTAQVQRIGIDMLKTAINDDRKANVFVYHKGGEIEKTTSYLCSIFSASNITDDEMWLLKQFVCLPSSYFGFHRLAEVIDPEGSQRGDVFSQALEGLVRKGWLLQNENSDLYKMHLIICEVMKKNAKIRPVDVERLIKDTCKQLNVERPDADPMEISFWTRIGRTLLNVFPDETDVPLAELSNLLGRILKLFGEDSEAKSILEKAVKKNEKIFGLEHPITALSNSLLGWVEKDLGNYSLAKDLLEKSLRWGEKENLESFSSFMPIWYSQLAFVHEALGNVERAQEYFEKALNNGRVQCCIVLDSSDEEKTIPGRCDKTLPDVGASKLESLHQATGFVALANMLHAHGDFLGAIELFQKALRVDEKYLGSEHPTTGKRYSKLALAFLALGKTPEAKSLLEKAKISIERNFGAEHPNTGEVYLYLSSVMKGSSEAEQALYYAKKALDVFQKNYPNGHLSIETATKAVKSLDKKTCLSLLMKIL
jgi:tetratricopeptide (TPR) repeat protein